MPVRLLLFRIRVVRLDRLRDGTRPDKLFKLMFIRWMVGLELKEGKLPDRLFDLKLRSVRLPDCLNNGTSPDTPVLVDVNQNVRNAVIPSIEFPSMDPANVGDEIRNDWRVGLHPPSILLPNVELLIEYVGSAARIRVFHA
jgi:hypothetical protein